MRELAWVTKFKTKWNIVSNTDFILTMLAFSLAGMGICFVRPIEFRLLHLDGAPMWGKIAVYPFLVVPSYYVGLMLFGFLLGRFEFSLKFTLNSLQRISRLFGRLKGTASNKL